MIEKLLSRLFGGSFDILEVANTLYNIGIYYANNYFIMQHYLHQRKGYFLMGVSVALLISSVN